MNMFSVILMISKATGSPVYPPPNPCSNPIKCHGFVQPIYRNGPDRQPRGPRR